MRRSLLIKEMQIKTTPWPHNGGKSVCKDVKHLEFSHFLGVDIGTNTLEMVWKAFGIAVQNQFL